MGGDARGESTGVAGEGSVPSADSSPRRAATRCPRAPSVLPDRPAGPSVVDDNATNRRIVTTLLDAGGCRSSA